LQSLEESDSHWRYQPFHRNDHIAVADFEGAVVGIDLHYTTLIAEDQKLLIPNSLLFNNPISLWTKEKQWEVHSGPGLSQSYGAAKTNDLESI
jgi:mechanosensitive ion channel-like protein